MPNTFTKIELCLWQTSFTGISLELWFLQSDLGSFEFRRRCSLGLRHTNKNNSHRKHNEHQLWSNVTIYNYLYGMSNPRQHFLIDRILGKSLWTLDRSLKYTNVITNLTNVYLNFCHLRGLRWSFYLVITVKQKCLYKFWMWLIVLESHQNKSKHFWEYYILKA